MYEILSTKNKGTQKIPYIIINERGKAYLNRLSMRLLGPNIKFFQVFIDENNCKLMFKPAKATDKNIRSAIEGRSCTGAAHAGRHVSLPADPKYIGKHVVLPRTADALNQNYIEICYKKD